VRELITLPVKAAGVKPPVLCDVPLVDAVLMTCDTGLLIPLANYTLKPLEKVTLSVATDRPITRVESAKRGSVVFTQADGAVRFTVPLEAGDFIKLYAR
jgi:hypothetical protein